MNNLVSNAVLSNLIHIPQTAEPQLVQLAEGHLLRATVQNVADNMALLNIGGNAISVRTEIPLQPQQRIILQVTQADSNQITLRVVNQSSPTPASASALPLTPPNLQSLLTSWDIDPDPTNQTIAKALFAHTHSLNPNSILEVRTLWQTTPALASLSSAPAGGGAGQLEALVYLHANQLPINQESLSFAQHWLNNSLPIAQRLNQLQTAMQAVQTHLQSASTPGQAQLQSNPALSQLQLTLATAMSKMGSLGISADTPREEIVARLANLVTTLGTPPESELAARYVSSEPDLAAEGGKRSASPAPTNGAGPPAEATTSQSHPAKFSAANGSGQPTATPDSAEITRNPLQRLAAVLNDILSTAKNLDEATTQALRNLSHQLESVAKDLGAIQLSNATNAPNPAMESFYMFPVPLNTPEGPTTAHLKVFRRTGDKAIDPNNLRLALLLDLPELGEIAVNLAIFENHLNGQFLSQQEETQQRVEMGLDELHQGLKKLGYRVDSLTSDSLAANEKTVFTKRPPIDHIEIPMPNINITA